MDLHEIQAQATVLLREASHAFQKVPGSAVLIRYVQASYQNDPIRSIFELFLLIFFIRYLLSPSYSTNDSNYVKLSEAEIEELIDEWQPEPLVSEQTPFEELETENLPVIVGYVYSELFRLVFGGQATNSYTQPDRSQVKALEWPNSHEPSILQLLQFQRERTTEREGYCYAAHLWCGTLWPSAILRQPGCAHED